MAREIETPDLGRRCVSGLLRRTDAGTYGRRGHSAARSLGHHGAPSAGDRRDDPTGVDNRALVALRAARVGFTPHAVVNRTRAVGAPASVR
jgi:hypothetical protein